jgi:tetratricopeptide (TPR) repeat protein
MKSRPFSGIFLPTLLLFGITFAVFAPSLRYGLVDFDDHLYLATHPLVMEGMSPVHVRTAFTSFHQGTYSPLLWLSYGLDAAVLNAMPAHPGGFHFTNVFLHALNSVLLFLLLFGFCKKPWRAFFFAALWALHPLRIESVAWIAERKDVLSGFFGLLCLGAYVQAWLQRTADHPRLSYTAGSLLFFACGLLVKPSLVPIPGALLLLDLWPLRRMEPTLRAILRALPRLIAEKIPYFVLAALAALASAAAHRTMHGLTEAPLTLRLAAVPVHYVFYLWKTVVPRHLSPLYPDLAPAVTLVLLSLLLLLALTAMTWRVRRRHPEGLVGWLFFLGVLVPAIGVVRFGAQSIADRFTYFPAMGLSIALLFLWSSPSSRHLRRRTLRLVLAAAALLGLAAATQHGLPVWQSPASFHEHMLARFPDHPMALDMRANHAIRTAGHFQQAAQDFDRILQTGSFNHAVLTGKARCLAALQGPAAAQDFLLTAPATDNPYAQQALLWDAARYALMLRHYDDAIRYAHRALDLPSENRAAAAYLHLLMMTAAFKNKDVPLALVHARQFPAYANKTSLEEADLLPYYLHQWIDYHRADAYAFFQRLIQKHPEQRGLINNLAWGLATADWSPAPPAKVLALAQQVVDSFPLPNAGVLDTLAAAQANAGEFTAAAQTLQQALDALPADPKRDPLRARLQHRRHLSHKNHPSREDAFSRLMATQFGKDLPATTRKSMP